MTHHFRTTTLATLLASAVALPAAAQDALPIAVQMYTLRDYGTLEEQLQAVEDAGVTAIETVGTHDVTAEEMTALLDEHGIEVISSHVQLDTLRDGIEDSVAFNKAIGNDTITVPYLAEEQRPTDAEGWQELGEELGGLAAELAAEDMRLAYHNHDFEMVDYDGRTALELMFEAAGPELLAEIDLAWV
ncbi:sugar phosphate isomerase/epimerase, partial [Mesobaculum littorinae]